MTNQINEEVKKKDEMLEDFKPKRVQAEKVFEMIGGLVSDDRVDRLNHCGTILNFLSNKEKDKSRLIKGNFCRDRFCPMCIWRKAIRDSLEVGVVMRALQEKFKYKFIFATFTIPNVPGEILEETITEMSKALTKMMRKVRFKNAIHGFVRKIEVTYNSERNDYHPHIHVIFAVDASYFKNPKKYIKHDEWLAEWRIVMENDLIDFVNLKRVPDEQIENASLEMAKYTVKGQDLAYSRKVLRVLVQALKGKRLITYSGVFKDYKKKLDDKENHELDKFIKVDETEYYYQAASIWEREQKEYVTEWQKLSDKEKEAVRKALNTHSNIYDALEEVRIEENIKR